MTVTLNEKECRALYLALSRGARHEREDLIGLFLKTSGSQLLGDTELIELIDKLECGQPGRNYPRYEMIFEGGTHYLPLWQAASWYDCGWTKVEIGQWVLQSDDGKSRRSMNDADRDAIRDAADRHSESK
jgi:hypothetical protein